jgi:hypothetical protein
MNHVRRGLAALAVLGGALFALGVTAPAALAMFPGSPGDAPAPVVHTVVVGGMPGWQIVLIAFAAAVVAVLADRAWAGRRTRDHAWLLLDEEQAVALGSQPAHRTWAAHTAQGRTR